MPPRTVSYAELAQHNSSKSCWTAIHGKVYDVTSFLAAHPGGASLLLSVAGRDGTAMYDGAHLSHGVELITSTLPPEAVLGDLDTTSTSAGEKSTLPETGPIRGLERTRASTFHRQDPWAPGRLISARSAACPRL